MRGDKATWTALQQEWRGARAARYAHIMSAELRWGPQWKQAATKTLLGQIKKADARQEKAAGKIYAWLEKYSPWDWTSGTSISWVCDVMPWEVATSPEAPWLPAEAVSYGGQQKAYQPQPKAEAVKDAQEGRE